jgi:hypothetical protein
LIVQPWKIFSGLGIAALLFITVLVPPAQAQVTRETPDFRIVDVRAEHGQMVVEVEHFTPQGTFWFYELYTFQGREGNNHARSTKAGDRLVLTDGTLVSRVNGKFILPKGKEWKRELTPQLDVDSVTGVIQEIHNQRLKTGWRKGKARLTVKPLNFTGEDQEGLSNLMAKFSPLITKAYRQNDKGKVTDFNYVGPGGPRKYPKETQWGTVSTFYSDATAIDGFTDKKDAPATWTTYRNAATSTYANLSTSYIDLRITTPSTPSGQWSYMSRGFHLFPTSAIPDGDTIFSATWDIVVQSVQTTFGGSLTLVTSTPASNTNLITSDYAQTGSIEQASSIPLTSLVTDSSTYNSFTLNPAGLASINKTGITKFGTRLSQELNNAEPSWISSSSSGVNYVPAEETLPGDKRPRLVVTHGAPTAAITGTIGDGATEQEVRDGGGTILVTLTDDSWVAAGATFDAQRQAIIDGLDAASSPTTGWNNEVRDSIGVGSVERTSATLATITLTASEVAGYAIASTETITVTVPAAALTGGVAITATPTIAITAATESAAVSGTLGGSGGTAAEIVAGEETVIITLTNTTWVTAGATFNAQRQNILDGLVADDSDVNGWNAMAFAVGDVVRTSGTIATITLSAESGYAIPSAETVTTTVPATAIVYGASLVAPETFTISPGAFATSGTRVSPAINLSGITDLAYCAIGWETTLPANTAVAIETSINGGSTYSTATNGNCPTGLTLGESLSTITDFRVKATLTTTNTAATPLITALGVILEDAGGSTLCYQLKTTPSAALADNCGTYTGTMSYPIGPSTITNTTAPITSTADPLPNARSLAGQDVAQAVTGSATSGRLFPAAGDEGGFVGLPLNDLVNDMSTVGDGLPVRFVWFIFLGIATIGAGMLAVHLTSNLFIAAGAMAAVMGFQMAIGSTGLLPGWILFAFIPLAGSFLLFRRGFPV